MPRMRVHELAKELGLTSRDLLAKMEEIGFSDKNHMSYLSEEEAAQVRTYHEQPKGSSLKLVESRVSGGVIRRRRNIVAEEEAFSAPAEVVVPPPPAETFSDELVPAAEDKKAAPAVREAEAEEAAPAQPRRRLRRVVLPSEPEWPEPKAQEPPAQEPPVKETAPLAPEAPAAAAPPPAVPSEAGREPQIDERYSRLRVVKRDKAAEEEEARAKAAREQAQVEAAGRAAGAKAAEAPGGRQVPRVEVFEMRGLPHGKFRPRMKTREKGKGKKTEITVPKAIKRTLKVGENIIIGDLAKKIGVKVGELIGKLMGMGMMVTINQSIDFETAQIVATDFGWELESSTLADEEVFQQAEDKAEDLKLRAPVVTVMGHVDHGKTKLLDAIRKTNVVDGEAGGITQHIGASEVVVSGKKIVFLDTPGHEAFTTLRARGAKVTDLVVLVVAADDGVMPQTKEAINHAKAAGAPIIVAINKMDKPSADPERVMKQLTEFEMVPEAWGGDTIYVPVSAKQGSGIKELLEMILLQAEVLELRANPDKPAVGTIIEARLDKGRGPVATVIVQQGTLRIGDTVVSGREMGKVRALFNPRGEPLSEAGPATAVELLGLEGIPQAGDPLNAVADERKARQLVDVRKAKAREVELAKSSKITLEALYQQIEEGEVKELKVVLKADVVGSLEALHEAFTKLSGAKVKVTILHEGVGAVTEGDVLLASASNAVVVGFNIRPEPGASGAAEREGVQVRLYTIIYEAVDELRKAMEGLLEPIFKEIVQGRLEVRNTFTISKLGTIAGCMVVSGKIHRQCQVRVVRDGAVVYTTKVGSLRRFKNDAREVAEGLECGVGLENFNDVKVGDVLESFTIEKEAATLD